MRRRSLPAISAPGTAGQRGNAGISAKVTRAAGTEQAGARAGAGKNDAHSHDW
jgi:hypothetical protein